MIFIFIYIHLVLFVSSELVLRTIGVSVTNAIGTKLNTAIPVQEGVSLNSGLLSELQPYGMIQCIRKCLLQQACVGVVHQGFRCSLGEHHDGFQSSFTPVNSVYVNKTSISDGLKQILITECNAASCGVSDVCQPLTTGYQCIAKEPQMVCNTSSGYVSYPDGCFQAVRTRNEQSEALAYCQQEGATLARIDSQAKYDAMDTEVGSGGLYYLEGFDANMDGNWVFDDGTPMTLFFNWYTSSYTPGSCIAYYPGNGITKMECTSSHYFLCEIR